MHQSIVEVGTKICADVSELREEIYRNRRELANAAERVGLAVAAVIDSAPLPSPPLTICLTRGQSDSAIRVGV
jgi:hypothetical protein